MKQKEVNYALDIRYGIEAVVHADAKLAKIKNTKNCDNNCLMEWTVQFIENKSKQWLFIVWSQPSIVSRYALFLLANQNLRYIFSAAQIISTMKYLKKIKSSSDAFIAFYWW